MRPNFDCRRTTGDIPVKLIGATITVIGCKAYIFGGRSAADNQALSDLFICDLQDFKWERLHFANVDFTPSTRFFHSADSWDDKLVIFGGYGLSSGSREHHLLNDVQIFDPASRRWLSALVLNRRLADSISLPRARHSHLSAVCADRLLVIGGEDANRSCLDDICIYDLKRKAWIQRISLSRRCVTYSGVATCADLLVRIPSAEHSSVYRTERFSSPPTSSDTASSSAPLHLPYSAEPTEQFPCKVYLYNNEAKQHTDTERSLEVFSPSSTDFVPVETTPAINGYPSPPFLRNLTGSIIGTHLIVAGTYLGRSAFYAIWSLNLQTMTWTHVDTGSNGASGSWSKGCLWRSTNKFLVFGDRNGTIAQDYSQRIMNWKDVIVIDLEVFGIYQPPPLALELMTQELCLVALEEAVQTDFQIICDDGRRIKCSRKILEARWPWFRNQLSKLLQQVHSAVETSVLSPQDRREGHISPENKPDYRIDTRYFDLGEPYSTALALLQYFYTLSLLTPLQQEPVILSRLLELSTALYIPHLQELAKHAMHLSLSEKNCAIYEAAVRRRPGCEGLQRRALKLLLQQSRGQNSGNSFLEFQDGSPFNKYIGQPPQFAPLEIPDIFTRPRRQSQGSNRPTPNRISPIAEDSPPLNSGSVEDDADSFTAVPVRELNDPRSDSVQSSHSDRDNSSGSGERSRIFAGLRSVFSPDTSPSRNAGFGVASRPSGSNRGSQPTRSGGGRRAYVHDFMPKKPPKPEKEKKTGGGARRSSNTSVPLAKSPSNSTVEHGYNNSNGHTAPHMNGNKNGGYYYGDPSLYRSNSKQFDNDDSNSSSDAHGSFDSHSETPVPGQSRSSERMHAHGPVPGGRPYPPYYP